MFRVEHLFHVEQLRFAQIMEILLGLSWPQLALASTVPSDAPQSPALTPP
jgi:hypothetical protein